MAHPRKRARAPQSAHALLAKMQNGHGEGQEIHTLDMNLVLRLSVELVSFKAHGH